MSNLKVATFGEWLEKWFAVYKQPNLQPTSVRNIEQMIRLHTPAWLKRKPITEITAFDIDTALAETPKGRTRNYTRQVWNSAFVKACKLGIVKQNIVELSEPAKYKKQRGKSLTITEQTQLLDKVHGTRIEWIVLFYLYTGVRRCEALTLQWQDIDYDENLILIKGTKTEDSYRHILLTDELKYILEQQRKQNEQDKFYHGCGHLHKTQDCFVFPFGAEHISRAFKQVCPSHHLHDLRHTFITRCAESGMNVSV
jgi:integrase